MVGQVLLVDSERNRSRLLQRRLERQGFTVVTASSLAEAADRQELTPSLLLVDLALVCDQGRDRIEQLMSRILKASMRACECCGRRVREVAPGAGVLVCCGEPMRLASSGPDPNETERKAGHGHSATASGR